MARPEGAGATGRAGATRVRVTVADTPLARRVWVRFPKRRVYPRSSLWTAPFDDDMLRLLDPKQNPTLRHTEALPLLARDAYGRVVGQLLVHVNHRHNVRHGERVAFFGFFECIDDADVRARCSMRRRRSVGAMAVRGCAGRSG